MLTQELAQELAVQELAQELTEELPQKLGEEDFVLALEEKPTQELAVQDMTAVSGTTKAAELVALLLENAEVLLLLLKLLLCVATGGC
ncbi:hypothetical protein PR003_g28699 [Phytophthora rubi]|uniref:Uncharacterized protein n=1 Tax=Phytophthora rubi TaxID=129364 RepID=A0A6A4BTM1_9STRA|nr:hypothetical protein PR003_g28699 [Phytophthora rubi]